MSDTRIFSGSIMSATIIVSWIVDSGAPKRDRYLAMNGNLILDGVEVLPEQTIAAVGNGEFVVVDDQPTLN